MSSGSDVWPEAPATETVDATWLREKLQLGLADRHILTTTWARWCHPDGVKTCREVAALVGADEVEVSKWSRRFLVWVSRKSGKRITTGDKNELIRERLLPIFEGFEPEHWDEVRAQRAAAERAEEWRQLKELAGKILPEVTRTSKGAVTAYSAEGDEYVIAMPGGIGWTDTLRVKKWDAAAAAACMLAAVADGQVS